MVSSENAWVFHQIENAFKHGMKVAINGNNYSNFPQEKMWMVLEEAPYMMDYEEDEEGRIIGVNFNRLSDS